MIKWKPFSEIVFLNYFCEFYIWPFFQLSQSLKCMHLFRGVVSVPCRYCKQTLAVIRKCSSESFFSGIRHSWTKTEKVWDHSSMYSFLLHIATTFVGWIWIQKASPYVFTSSKGKWNFLNIKLISHFQLPFCKIYNCQQKNTIQTTLVCDVTNTAYSL